MGVMNRPEIKAMATAFCAQYRPTKSQQIMIDDGLPASLARDPSAPPAPFQEKKPMSTKTQSISPDLAAATAAAISHAPSNPVAGKKPAKVAKGKTSAKKTAAAKPAKAPAAKKAAKPAAKPAKAPAAAGERSRYDWTKAEEMAAAGKMPPALDFSAPTHARFVPALNEVKAAAKAGDVKALKAVKINPVSSSPKALDRYRNLCVKALAKA